MKFRIGKDGSGSNIHASKPSKEGLLLLGANLYETPPEDVLRAVLARGITIYTCRDYNFNTGSGTIIASKDNKRWKDIGSYAIELGLSPEEAEQLEQDVIAAMGQGIAGSWYGEFVFAFCAAHLSQMYVLHRRDAPYLLRLLGGKMVAHVNKQWHTVVISSPWSEEAAPEICGENLKLYGENDASVSLVPASNAKYAGSYEYDLFQQDESVYAGDIALGDLLPLDQELVDGGIDYANLFKRITPPKFGTYRMDAWPQDVDKCRVPALKSEQVGEFDYRYMVKALVPGGPVSFEQRDADPNSLAAFFTSAPAQFENYYIPFRGDTDYSLAQTPTPVSQGGLGPVRPGLYYKEGRLVAIITGEYYGHIKGAIFTESGDEVVHAEYEKVSGIDGVITHAYSWTERPSDTYFPDEIGGAEDPVRGQGKTTTRLVRHFLHEATAPAAATDDGAIEFRIALTIKTGTAKRFVDNYRSTTVSIEGFSKDNASFDWRANLGTEENPVEAWLEKTTDENGRKVLIVPLDQGALETETDANGLFYYSPLQEVTILIYSRFTSSSVVGSFRTAPDEDLDFDTYVPYEISDLGIRGGAANMLPRGA